MSAIAALFSLNDGKHAGEIVARMLATLEHRGEGESQLWSDENIQLGHRARGAGADSAGESLPRRCAASGAAITCNARIDNREDIARKLGIFDGVMPSDSELILTAYEKWGEDCAAELIGDFVFAIWDPRKSQLFCARDPLGVKHFYYYHEPGKFFAVASEAKALFCVPGVRRELNEQSIGDYLAFNFEDKESTFFKGISRLPATHTLTIASGDARPRVRCYWKPNNVPELKLGGPNEYYEAFRERFREAVAARVESPLPVGSMLSGGLDSSAITCIAGEEVAARGTGPLHTFSAVYPETSKDHPALDELRFMRSVAEMSGSKAHYVDCDAIDAWGDMPRVMQHADQPVGMANLHVHLECLKAASAQGVRVLLDGTDGDTTVSHGYEAFGQLAARGRLISLFKNAKMLKGNMPQKAHSLENLAFRMGIDQVVPSALENAWHSLTRRYRTYGRSTNTEFDKLQWLAINKDFRREHNLESRFVHFAERRASESGNAIAAHWNDLTSGHYARILETAEAVSQSYGIEMRFPFFDRRLIEFCIAVPPIEKIRNGWTRSVFRHAMTGTIPAEVQWRTTKGDLGPGLKLNMINYSSCKLDSIVNSGSGVLHRFVDMDFLKRVYRRFSSEPFKSDHDCLVLVSVAHLHDWLCENGLSGKIHKAA